MAFSDHQHSIIKNIEKHIDLLLVPSHKKKFDIIENIEKHIRKIKQWIPTQAIIAIGNNLRLELLS